MKTSINKEFFEKWKNKAVTMHCKTFEEAEEFCKLMHSNGLKWCSGDIYLGDIEWERYKENTCYYFNEGEFGDTFTCNQFTYLGQEYKILEFSDYIVEGKNENFNR